MTLYITYAERELIDYLSTQYGIMAKFGAVFALVGRALADELEVALQSGQELQIAEVSTIPLTGRVAFNRQSVAS